MSAPDPFALGGHGTTDLLPRPSEKVRQAAAELAAAILRAIPDYDLSLSFLDGAPSAKRDGGAS